MIKNLAIGGGSNKLLLVFALVLGLIAAVLVGVYLSSLNGDNGSTGSTTTVPVVVAAQDIPAATTVTAEMVVVKAVPSDLALIGAYADSTAAVGQVTQVAVQAGEQITPGQGHQYRHRRQPVREQDTPFAGHPGRDARGGSRGF
jgi:Flp pilus assembly protein CpaB